MQYMLKLITAITVTYISVSHAYAANQDLLVSNGIYNTGVVLRYDGETKEFLGAFNMDDDVLRNPQGMTFGPDGNLYVANIGGMSVDVYDGTTGEFIDSFSGPGVFAATDVTFGPDGNIYVTSANYPDIARFDGTTRRWLGWFTSGGNLQGPDSVAFGPDGNLYVSSFGTNNVQRFDGTTGQFIDNFVPNSPSSWGLAFGPDGNLYVASGFSIDKYSGQDGHHINSIVGYSYGLRSARGLTFGPDGYLYVANNAYGVGGNVMRFDPRTGAFIDVFASGDELQSPYGLTFTPPSDNNCAGQARWRCLPAD